MDVLKYFPEVCVSVLDGENSCLCLGSFNVEPFGSWTVEKGAWGLGETLRYVTGKWERTTLDVKTLHENNDCLIFV